MPAMPVLAYLDAGCELSANSEERFQFYISETTKNNKINGVCLDSVRPDTTFSLSGLIGIKSSLGHILDRTIYFHELSVLIIYHD